MILHGTDNWQRLTGIRDSRGWFSTLLVLFPPFVLWIQLCHAVDLGIFLGGGGVGIHGAAGVGVGGAAVIVDAVVVSDNITCCGLVKRVEGRHSSLVRSCCVSFEELFFNGCC